jgi:hypothetical protein
MDPENRSMEPNPSDPLDSFYQQLDSEQLLQQHGKDLLAEARELLAREPMARVCGFAAMPDSREAAQLREVLRQLTGQETPPGRLVGLMPRAVIEPMLRANVDPAHWGEEAWQPQRVLTVMASTRDGMRFGFFALAQPPADA